MDCGILLIGITVALCLYMLGTIIWLVTSLILDKRREKRYIKSHTVYNIDNSNKNVK